MSVGRNSKLLLNVPPTRAGLLHATDVARLVGLRERLAALLRTDHAVGRALTPRLTDGLTSFQLDLGRTAQVSIADLREDVATGQRFARYVLEGSRGGEWQVLSRGTTIGFRKLDRFAPANVQRIRLRVEEALDTPRLTRLALY